MKTIIIITIVIMNGIKAMKFILIPFKIIGF
jgi:hypothetical protein